MRSKAVLISSSSPCISHYMDKPSPPLTQHPHRTQFSRNTLICLLIALSLLFAAGLEVLSPAQTSMHKLFNKLGGKHGQAEGQQPQQQEGWQQGGQASPQVSSAAVPDAQQGGGKVMVAYFVRPSRKMPPRPLTALHARRSTGGSTAADTSPP